MTKQEKVGEGLKLLNSSQESLASNGSNSGNTPSSTHQLCIELENSRRKCHVLDCERIGLWRHIADLKQTIDDFNAPEEVDKVKKIIELQKRVSELERENQKDNDPGNVDRVKKIIELQKRVSELERENQNEAGTNYAQQYNDVMHRFAEYKKSVEGKLSERQKDKAKIARQNEHIKQLAEENKQLKQALGIPPTVPFAAARIVVGPTTADPNLPSTSHKRDLSIAMPSRIVGGSSFRRRHSSSIWDSMFRATTVLAFIALFFVIFVHVYLLMCGYGEFPSTKASSQ